MPTSPLPNSAVSLLPPAEDIVVVLVLSLPLPQAARKAASAVEPPPTARNLRLDWGPASCFTSGIAQSPPGRLLALLYGQHGQGGSESPDVSNWRGDAWRGAADAGVDRLGAERLGAVDRALLLGRAGGGGVPARRLWGDRAAPLHPGGATASGRVAVP